MDSVAGTLTKYTLQYPQEKIYVVTDKPYYSLGDTIWFQTYLTDALTHRPAAISTTLYVELLNAEGKMLRQVILHSPNGLAPGDFQIPADWSPGKYMIQAYTQWMLNFREDHLFRKKINIFPMQQDEEEPGTKDQPSQTSPYLKKSNDKQPLQSRKEIAIQFFPEGGNLVYGIPSKIGFKATWSYSGKGARVKGKILNRQGTVLANLKSNPYGIGAFYLGGIREEIYVQLDSPNVTVAYEFPEVVNNSYSLQIANGFVSNKVLVSVETDGINGLRRGFLIGHSRGQLFFNVSFDEAGKIKKKLFAFDKSKIPSGIMHFTYFDSLGVPRAERLIFVDHRDQLLPSSIVVHNNKIKKRNLVKMTIRLPDTTPAHVSLSVTNAQVIRRDSCQENLESYLLLSSDLNGHIEAPSYYFLARSPQKHAELDYLMLTHGWRRFRWEDLKTEEQEAFKIPPERGIVLSGQLKEFLFRKKAVKGVVQLITYADQFSFLQSETDEQGYFAFENLFFRDSLEFILQAKKTAKATKNRFFIDLREARQPASSSFSGTLAEEEIDDSFFEKSYKQFTIEQSFGTGVIILDEIQIVGETEDPFESIVQGYTSPDYRLIIDSVTNPPPMLLDLIRTIPFTQIDPSTGLVTLRQQTADIFLNGIRLDGALASTFLTSTFSSEIHFIDVDRTGVSTNSGRVALHIYTNFGSGIQGASQDTEIPGVLHVSHPGYYKAREFYAPKYDPSLPAVVKPDYRLQLFWEPQVKIINGQADVAFYAGDDREVFDIHMEGLTESGKIIRTTRKISVQ